MISVPGAISDFAGLLLNAIARKKGASPHLYLNQRYAYQFASSEKARMELGYRARPLAEIVQDYRDYVKRRSTLKQ